VQDFSAKSVACTVENDRLRGSRLPRIAAATAERDDLAARLSSSSTGEVPAIRERMTQLAGQIAGLRRELSTRAETCAKLVREFEIGRAAYYAQVDKGFSELSDKKRDLQALLDAADKDARDTLKNSDSAIEQNSIPDLVANVRALIHLVHEDPNAFVLVFSLFLFFWMLDLMPVIWKLTAQAADPYEKEVEVQNRKLAAQAEADAVRAEMHSSLAILEATVEREALAQFYKAGGGQIFVERAREQVAATARKARLVYPLEIVKTLMQGMEDLQGRMDKLEDRFGGNPDAIERIEEIRRFWRAMMQKTLRMIEDMEMGGDYAEAAE
jgi:Domain of unknown function (DUF4407)